LKAIVGDGYENSCVLGNLGSVAKPGLESAHLCGSSPSGVSVAHEVEKSVQNIGKNLISQVEAVTAAQQRRDGRTDHDFAVRKC